MGAFELEREQKIVDGLLEMLFSSFPARMGEDGVWEVASAFSGGLDSTVLTAAALRHFGSAVSVAPVVVGVPGSKDLNAAATAAEELGLGLELEEVVLGPANVIEAVPKVVEFTGSMDPVVISFTIPVYFVLTTEGPREVLIGHGGDELFGGYARYVGIPPSELQGHLDADLDVAKGRVEADRHMARALGRELVTPFLSKDFIEKVRTLPPELKVSGDERKVALRMMARSLGLSDRLVDRKKTAAQYGSGVMKVLKSETKRRGLSKVADLIRELSGR